MTIKRRKQFCGRIGTFSRLLILLLLPTTLCGFTWGAPPAPCAEAVKILADYPSGITDRAAERIVALCPDGAAGQLAKGFQAERKGATAEAIVAYRQAIAADFTLSQAHGNLGLLLLQQGLDNEAVSELNRAIKGDSNPRYHRGLALLLSRGAGTALLVYHAGEALQGNPDDPEVHSWLAEAYVKQEDLDKAAREYGKVLAVDTANEHARLGLAYIYSKSGRLDDAIRELTAVSAARPANKEIHTQLAGIYLQKGDQTLANKELLLAGLKPGEVDIDRLTRQGDQLLLARKYDKAIKEYEAILKKQPEWPGILEKLGAAQMAAGRDDEAIKTYRQAIRLDQSNSSLHYTLGILSERKGLLDEAEVEYQKSLQYDASNGDAHRRLADLYTMRGKFRQAIEEYTELVKLRGTNPIIHFKLGRVYEQNREFPQAIDEYLTAIRLAPDNLEVRKDLAALYRKRGMAVEAEGQYREILRVDATDRGIRNALLSSYITRKNYDGLLLLLKDAVQQAPNDANSHYRLAVIYNYRKEYAAAAAEYQKAIDLDPGHAKALFALGKLCLKAGDKKKAKDLLVAARAADPNFNEPFELLSTLRDRPVRKFTKHRKVKHKSKKTKKVSRSRKKVGRKTRKH